MKITSNLGAFLCLKRKILRIMKLTTVLLMAGFLQVSANTFAQHTISELNAENKSVREIFKLIENKSTFRFFYNEDFADLNKVLSLNVKNKKIDEVLGMIFSRSNVTYRVLENNLVVITPSENESAVRQQVTGRVTDAKTHEPLPGVTVAVEGTSKGAITDAQGKFSIEVTGSNSILVFSFMGYIVQKVPAGNQTELEVKLEPDTKKLEEVVVMGYSTTTQKNLTGAAQVVGETKLKDVTATSVDKMLQGKVSGVYVGSSTGDPSARPTVRIRGNGTLTAGNDPLVVVDGIIGGIPNPSDIESVTVLKDAAATTLYGARAANGVMVITTKRGRSGKTQISVRATGGVSKLNNGRFKLMDTPGYYNLLYNAAKRDYTPDQFNQFLQSNIPESIKSTNTNWQDVAFQSATNQNYELAASGGNEKTKFYLGANYYKEDGILKGSGLERYSARLNLDHNVTDRFRIGFNVAGTLTNSLNTDNGQLYQSYINLPWDKPYDNNGNPVDPRVAPVWYGRDQSNFMYDMQYNRNKRRFTNLEALLKLEYDITSWLSFSTTNRAELYNYREITNGDSRTSAGADDQGNLTGYYNNAYTYISSNLLKARYTINKVHNIDGLIGAEFQTFAADSISASGKGILPGREVLDGTSSPVTVGGNNGERAFNSYFLQANYNYNYKYYFTTSFRRDGSSKFGEEKQYGNFYAFGASWVMSEENFLKGNNTITNLKLRASYGTTGNANIDDYLAIGSYRINTQYNSQPGAYPGVYGVPFLSWEKSYNANVGFDLGLFERINLSVDIYQKDNKDLLFNVPLPATAGYGFITENIGAVRNRGIEVSISTDNIKGAFTWSTDFNIGFNKNRITELYGGKNEIVDPLSGNFILRKGADMRTFYMRKWIGVDPANGNPLWEKLTVDADGKLVASATSNYNEATLQSVGTATPDFFGGIRNVWSYKGFTLSAFFSFVYGNQVYNNNRELFDNDGAYYTYNMQDLDKKWSRWEKPGDVATHPKFVIGGNKNAHKGSSRFLEDGSFLRLRNVNLSYSLPQSLLDRLKLSNVRISVGGDNLWTLTKFSGIDPEVNDRGTIGTKYPYSTKWLAGLEINF